MKIESIKTFVTEDGVFVKVVTDSGLYGMGEAGLKRRGFAVAEVIRAMEPDLIGEDPRRIEFLWQLMFRGGFFPGGNIQTAAASAVDIALWDIKAKDLNVPAYEILGGRFRDRVACYPHNHEPGEIDKLLESCRQTKEQGWRFVRWGIVDPAGGDRFEPDRAVRFGIEQVRAVRREVGEDIGIIVDLHTRLDAAASVRFCRGVEPYRPFFIEDPVRSEDPRALRRVRSQTSVPLAAGEQWAGKWAFRDAIEEDLIDYCRVDLCIAGGLSEARKIAGWAETHYIALAPHNPLGPVSTAACLQLCMASPLVGVMELPRVPGKYLTDLFPVQAEFRDGFLLRPDKPGLGIEFDEAAAAEGRALPQKARWFQREDGSYTNW
jgi:galactonate dehydratase